VINRILVICIGNICRSPIAEGLLKRAWPDKTVVSAGLGALVGHPAAPFSVQLMAEQGIDIGAHRAQSVTSALIRSVDLILTMDLAQKRHIEQTYPTARGKVFRLGESDIPDPYRQDMAVFRQTYHLLSQGVDALTARVAHID
jgi:protein-tyrosine phosphatase